MENQYITAIHLFVRNLACKYMVPRDQKLQRVRGLFHWKCRILKITTCCFDSINNWILIKSDELCVAQKYSIASFVF